MPGIIASVVNSRLATFAELDSVLSVEDCYDLLEIIAVEAANRAIAEKEE